MVTLSLPLASDVESPCHLVSTVVGSIVISAPSNLTSAISFPCVMAKPSNVMGALKFAKYMFYAEERFSCS